MDRSECTPRIRRTRQNVGAYVIVRLNAVAAARVSTR